jgi:hypothetical protein
MLALAIAALVALGLIGVGVGALAMPRRFSQQFGIVLDDPRALAFIRALGVRDLGIGILLLLLAWAERRELLPWGLAAAALIAFVDYAVVSAAGASRAARALHALGGITVLVAAIVVGWLTSSA